MAGLAFTITIPSFSSLSDSKLFCTGFTDSVSSLRIPEFDFLVGKFGGRVRGRGGREVTIGSRFILRARLSKDPLLLLLLFLLGGLSVVVLVSVLVLGREVK